MTMGFVNNDNNNLIRTGYLYFYGGAVALNLEVGDTDTVCINPCRTEVVLRVIFRHEQRKG